jgi:hypothetical protein
MVSILRFIDRNAAKYTSEPDTDRIGLVRLSVAPESLNHCENLRKKKILIYCFNSFYSYPGGTLTYFESVLSQYADYLCC